MNFKDFFAPHPKIQETVIKENVQKIVAHARTIRFKKSMYSERENFEYPNASLYEISRAISTDSYISESLHKQKEKIFKAGYYLRGKEECVDYLKKRFSLMSFMNETIFDVMLQELANDFIEYQNAYLFKIRGENLPDIKAIPYAPERCDQIVTGYMRLDPRDIIVIKDKYNNLLRYEIETPDAYENQKIAIHDLIHFYDNRKGIDKQGTPRLEPALEDVKALRDIEGDVLTLVHRFCFPMYHVKVGIAQQGYNGTQTDIDIVKEQIEEMTEDGMLVTNEKVDIATVGAQNNALEMGKYLDYFEKRVFSGLNTSQIQMGRDGQSTPDTLEAQVHDTVKHYQKYFAIFMEHGILNDLLLEGGFNPILNLEDKVQFVFNEISIDTRIKVENHESLKYQSNVQTLTETRQGLGQSENVDESDLYLKNVTLHVSDEQTKQKTEGAIELAEINSELIIKQQKALPQQNSSGSSGSSSANNNRKKMPDRNNKKNSESKSNTQTRNRPENQHGIYSVKVKESLERSVLFNNKREELIHSATKLYLKSCDLEFEEQLKSYTKINAKCEKLLKAIPDVCEVYLKNTIKKSNTQTLHTLYCEAMQKDLDKLFAESQKLDNLTNKAYRIRFIMDYHSKKYLWHLYALERKAQDFDVLHVHFSSDKDREAHASQINLSQIKTDSLQNVDQLPPYHPGCGCQLSTTKERVNDSEK